MTNKEKYLDELMKIWETGKQFGIIDGEFVKCDGNTSCSKCVLYHCGSCPTGREEWLKKESGVKASTLPVDTRIVLHSKVSGESSNRYFSHFNNECIYYFCGGSTSWSSGDIDATAISELGTFTVTLEDGTSVLFE